MTILDLHLQTGGATRMLKTYETYIIRCKQITIASGKLSLSSSHNQYFMYKFLLGKWIALKLTFSLILFHLFSETFVDIYDYMKECAE